MFCLFQHQGAPTRGSATTARNVAGIAKDSLRLLHLDCQDFKLHYASSPDAAG